MCVSHCGLTVQSFTRKTLKQPNSTKQLHNESDRIVTFVLVWVMTCEHLEFENFNDEWDFLLNKEANPSDN